MSPNLFIPAAPAPPAGVAHSLCPRDYQEQDVGCILDAYAAGKRGVVVRHSTGLGKSVIVAMLSARFHRRALVVVDVTSLAIQLRDTLQTYLSEPVGYIAQQRFEQLDARVIVATAQTLWSRSQNGRRRFENVVSPQDFDLLCVDECETSLGAVYCQIVQHCQQNPNLLTVGLSATPFRTDGRGMGELYDHAVNEPGPLNRDLRWGFDEGWLVPLRSGFIRVNVDFSTLKLRPRENGDRDYADAELKALLDHEESLIEIAHGIRRAAGDDAAIVICPQDTSFADKLAAHLNGVDRGWADAVHSHEGDSAQRVAAYKRGDLPCLVSVNTLFKGFDSDRVRHGFFVRRTTSRRLYEQGAGRATRPLTEIRPLLAAAPDAAARRAIIASSGKPYSVVWDLLGIAEKAKDVISPVDILGGDLDQEARDRAVQRLIDGDETDPSKAIAEAEEEVEQERAEAQRRRDLRERLHVQADVEIEVSDRLVSVGAMRVPAELERAVNLLLKGRWTHKEIADLTPKQIKLAAREQWRRFRLKLSTRRQNVALRKAGLTDEQLWNMPKARASELMALLEANHYRLPPGVQI